MIVSNRASETICMFIFKSLASDLLNDVETRSELQSTSLKTIAQYLEEVTANSHGEEISQLPHSINVMKAKEKFIQKVSDMLHDDKRYEEIDNPTYEIEVPWLTKDKGKDLGMRMKSEWRNMLQFVTTESGVLLQLHFSSEMETARIYNRLITELESLSNTTKAKKSELLLKMTQMKMEIKDLTNEIEFLRGLLAERVKDFQVDNAKKQNDN